jgi:uncharacterized protein (DUF58 family)
MSGRVRKGTRVGREGWVLFALTAGLAFVAVVSGNNLLYMVFAVLVGVGLLDIGLGHWNLRGLSASRQLPVELFAERDARGRFVLRNERRWLSSMSVSVQELGPGGASAYAMRIEPLTEVEVPAGWRFDQRGEVALGRVRLASTFPFGLATRWRDLDRPGAIVVYARPRGGGLTMLPDAGGVDGQPTRGQGGAGDFA